MISVKTNASPVENTSKVATNETYNFAVEAVERLLPDALGVDRRDARRVLGAQVDQGRLQEG